MSHTATYICHIKRANAEVLHYALRWMEQQGFLKNLQNLKEYAKKLSIGMTVPTHMGARSVSIYINAKGEVTISADEWGWETQFAEFKKRFEQVYQAVATRTAMAQLGYKTEMQWNKERQTVYLMGVQ